MKDGHNYCVALFHSVSHVIKAEKILKEAGIPHKVIPVPRIISSDCGVCLRFLKEQKEAVTEALDSVVEVSEIRELLL
jgi:uncharacterized protein YqgV (UPF0045/DUF77 family)